MSTPPSSHESRRPEGAGTRRRLGRGLAALLAEPVQVDEPRPVPETKGDDPTGPPSSPPAPSATDAGGDEELVSIALGAIRPNPRQPRTRFDDASLGRLAESIRSAGLMQPVLVRRVPEGDGAAEGVRYELVAGERRWRAAGIAGLASIPALVRDLEDQVAAELALVENLQREDLDPIERAEAFRRLQEDFALRHAEIAERVGIDRSSVSNHLRLLDLPVPVREAMQAGDLSMGHGRALLGLEVEADRMRLADATMREGWSVRQLEQRVRETRERSEGGGAPEARPPSARQLHLAHLSERIESTLGTKVSLVARGQKGGGELRIAFYDHDQFEGLLDRLGVRLED